MQPEKKSQEIEIKLPDNLIGGAYSNNAVISHTKEEFIMTFMMIAPPNGIVTSRVIMSPGHMKRFISALQENVKIYESNIGKIEEAQPLKTQMGFKTT
jgi:Protein of unknown function (DUF3467)